MKHAAIPGWQEVGRETLIVLGSAILAAFLVGQFPTLREWMKAQGLDTPRNLP
jgi:hypothetical protein